MMHCLHFIKAQFNFWVTAEHIQGSLNTGPTPFHATLSPPLRYWSQLPASLQQTSQGSSWIFWWGANRIGHQPVGQLCSVSGAINQTLLLNRSTLLSYFCSMYHVSSYPTKEDILCNHAAYLADQGSSHQTIKCYLSAIKHQQISLGLPDLHMNAMPHLEQILRDKGG